jgi:hypothetical protein
MSPNLMVEEYAGAMHSRQGRNGYHAFVSMDMIESLQTRD